MAAVRSTLLLMLCLATATACHRFETVTELSTVAGARGRLTLTPEGRATNARRLGGVAMEITGTLVQVPGDSIGIRADQVRYADLGTVPFAQGELHFVRTDIASVATETFDRKKTVVATVLALLGVIAIGIVAAPGDGIFGFGKSGPPTPR